MNTHRRRLLIVESHPFERGFYWQCLTCGTASAHTYADIAGAWDGGTTTHSCIGASDAASPSAGS